MPTAIVWSSGTRPWGGGDAAAATPADRPDAILSRARTTPVVSLRQAGREVRVAPGVHLVLAETSDREDTVQEWWSNG